MNCTCGFDTLWHLDLWCLCVTVFRARFSLLTIALPIALACVALWSGARGALYSIFLPRGFRDGDPDRKRTFWDLFWTAFTSCCVVTLAGAGVAVATMHGPERTPSAMGDAAACRATLFAAAGSTGTDHTLAWPAAYLVAAIAAAAVLPLACIVIWQREQSQLYQRKHPFDVPLAIGSLLAGAMTAAVVVGVVGVVRQSLFGGEDWILPLRPPSWVRVNLSCLGDWLVGCIGPRIGRLLGSAGYLDAWDRLLTGQAELILILSVASVAYAWFLILTAWTKRPHASSCTAVYLLVVIGAVGVFLGGAAFWADRYSLSTPLLIGAVAVAIACVAKTDHFFPLSAPHGRRDLPSLTACFAARIANIPADPARPRTAIVVTASGGGIQASAWTAEVLTRLAAEIPHFEDSLCLVSGVSGGSVGAGNFLTGTYPRDDARRACACKAPHPSSPCTAPGESAATERCQRCKRLQSIRDRSRASLLEHVAWGIAFADLPRLVLGWIPRNRLVDRGWAIERLIDKRLDRSSGDASRFGPPPSPTLRDLCDAAEDGTMPVPLFNATCVQTGQRVIAAPVSFAADNPSETVAKPTDDRNPPREEPRHGSRPLFMPEDFSAGEFQANPTLATVIRLSATFGYVSPVARPTRADEARWREAVSAQHINASAATAQRFRLHFCDGGYADNSGVVSAVEACRHLLAAIRTEKRDASTPSCRILFIRIESFPEETGQAVESSSGVGQMLFGPASSLLSARIIAQEERAKRELEALGNDAKGNPQENLPDVPFRAITIRYGARRSPPLSWALSQRQQEAIEEEWKVLHTSSQHFVEVFPPAARQPAATTLTNAINWPPDTVG